VPRGACKRVLHQHTRAKLYLQYSLKK
jgi:hypothetical protein